MASQQLAEERIFNIARKTSRRGGCGQSIWSRSAATTWSFGHVFEVLLKAHTEDGFMESPPARTGPHRRCSP